MHTPIFVLADAIDQLRVEDNEMLIGGGQDGEGFIRLFGGHNLTAKNVFITGNTMRHRSSLNDRGVYLESAAEAQIPNNLIVAKMGIYSESSFRVGVT